MKRFGSAEHGTMSKPLTGVTPERIDSSSTSDTLGWSQAHALASATPRLKAHHHLLQVPESPCAHFLVSTAGIIMITNVRGLF